MRRGNILKNRRIPGRDQATPRPRGIQRAKLGDLEPAERAKLGIGQRGELRLLEANHGTLATPNESFNGHAFLPTVQASHIPRQKFVRPVSSHEGTTGAPGKGSQGGSGPRVPSSLQDPTSKLNRVNFDLPERLKVVAVG